MTDARFTAELVLDARADLGEGPVWHPRTQRLLFVDITNHRIHEYDPAGGAHRTLETGAMVGCVVPRANGELVAALGDGLWRIDPQSGRREFLLAPAEHDPGRCRFNDGKCDPQGRLWAGTMGLNAERGLGALYCFPSAHACRRELGAISISNGLAWTGDGRTLFYIDSPNRRVDAFEFDPGDGRLGPCRPALTLPDGDDLPDGCTIDEEDMLWVAHWGGARVTRWDPRTGRQLATVAVPAPHVTSCAFGGADLATLYITTARNGLDAPSLAKYPASGGIFAARPGVRGRPAEMFAG